MFWSQTFHLPISPEGTMARGQGLLGWRVQSCSPGVASCVTQIPALIRELQGKAGAGFGGEGQPGWKDQTLSGESWGRPSTPSVAKAPLSQVLGLRRAELKARS